MRAAKQIVALMLAASASMLAQADSARLPRDLNKTWLEECGSCHLAYPPSLLTAENWRAMMGSLDKHFGANATLDAKSAAEISAWLERNAARGDRNAAATLRITDTRWFQRKHHEVDARTWKDPKVKSAANCGACHPGAAKGLYEEDDIVIPMSRR